MSELNESSKPIKPIGKFILDNAEGVELSDGTYYHYAHVCILLNKHGKNLETQLAECKEWMKTSVNFLTLQGMGKIPLINEGLELLKGDTPPKEEEGDKA